MKLNDLRNRLLKNLPNFTTDEEWQFWLGNMQHQTSLNYKHELTEELIEEINNDREYAIFIESILEDLSHGRDAICYKPFQIFDLLYLTSGHLTAEYLPKEECFRVHLYTDNILFPNTEIRKIGLLC